MKKRNQKILVIGSGGREHAIVKALKRSERVGKIYCVPGNAGIADDAECVNISVTDTENLAKFAEDKAIDLTVVGPEASLAAGVVDKFQEKRLKIFGPTKQATQIESSKEFAKRLMKKYQIPTGNYETFTDFNEAFKFVKSHSLPTVIKYDGLAAGKGVVVAMSNEEAEAALRDMLLDETFGKGKVIIEEFLEGPEFSFMCLVSGNNVYPLAPAQDHKRVFEGDEGPNTGGMGAYSPVPFITDEMLEKTLHEIMIPAAEGMVKDGTPFTGVLYGGLILTKEGPKVIEFNARFGDPETEVVLPRLKTDILTLFESVLAGEKCEMEWADGARLGIVLASKGYPGSYEKGVEIKGLERISSEVCHMGTKRGKNGELLTSGGRVLMVIAEGSDLKEARKRVLDEISSIECESLFHRSDIGWQVINN